MSADAAIERRDETVEEALAQARLPRIHALTPVEPAPPPPEPPPQTPMFDALVREDADTAGLLAYALHEQTRRDWLHAYHARIGAEPTALEMTAFIEGEGLPRRLATYRRLAEDMLRGHAQAARPAAAAPTVMSGAPSPAAAPAKVAWKPLAFWLAMLVVMAVAFRFAASWLFR